MLIAIGKKMRDKEHFSSGNRVEWWLWERKRRRKEKSQQGLREKKGVQPCSCGVILATSVSILSLWITCERKYHMI